MTGEQSARRWRDGGEGGGSTRISPVRSLSRDQSSPRPVGNIVELHIQAASPPRNREHGVVQTFPKGRARDSSVPRRRLCNRKHGYRPHPRPPVPLPTCSYPSVAGRSLRSLGLRAFARGAVAPSGPDGPVGRRGDADGAARSPSPPLGAERAGVRWGCLLSHSAWRDPGTDALRRAAHHGPANREGRGSGSPRPRRGGPPPACRASRRRACSSSGTGCGR